MAKKYIDGLTIFGVPLRVNIDRALDIIMSGDELVAKANETVEAMRRHDKATATDMINKFREDFNFALTDDLFHKDDVKKILNRLNAMETMI